MAPNINNPGGVKNDPDEIRDGVVSDATRFPGGFIDEQITEAGAAVQIVGQYQLNNAAFDRSFDISSQVGNPHGIAFKPDGGRMYVIGRTSDTVSEFSLSTAFDVSTATFVRSFSISQQDDAARGLTVQPDGTELYVAGRQNSNIYQYSLSTGFDISTASFLQSFDVSPQDPEPTGVAFKPDGTQLYVSGGSTINIYQYSLSTAFDVSTATFVRSFDVSPQDDFVRGLTFQPDGRRMYISGRRNDTVFQYNLSTAFNISTATFNQTLDVSPQSTNPRGLTFKPDGSRLYVVTQTTTNVNQYAVGFVAGELG